MNRIPILPQDLLVNSYTIWNDSWFLLTSGDFSKGNFNTMTVSWGSLGCVWNRPFAQVFIRPTRYTFSFIEKFPTFSLCVFSPDYRKDLDLLGARSGRDGYKIALTNLTPIAANKIAAPIFAEAELVLECRKMYWSDMIPANFLDPKIERQYPQKDYHRIYFGEILFASGIDSYIA
jgi:flavin reductase (DIM6/NTAB) family NADH-FMN oxidoreductase RutF